MNATRTWTAGATSDLMGLRLFAFAAVCSLGGAVLGGVAGASTNVTSGIAEQGAGMDVGQQSLTYWIWESVHFEVIPPRVPPAASTVAGAPTVLPRVGASYVLGPSTPGDSAFRWVFEEGAGAPQSTELELRFVAGTTNPAVHITIYVETQAIAPLGAPTYRFYWDAGTASPSSITVETLQVTVLVCASVGHCP